MLRLTLTALTALALTGCTEGPAGGSSPATAAASGLARQLTPGMTEEQVFTIAGTEAGYERNPDNWDQACLSYGSEGSYTHATFENGVLLSASDGHATLCTYGG
ncbi:hypothetical protein [Tropicibacter sp. S64]|uniref:hypothetical protein n=1 Tax=Tropicibacter sp. S64 TaxID=3415122 RepID=UPI003C7D1F00